MGVVEPTSKSHLGIRDLTQVRTILDIMNAFACDISLRVQEQALSTGSSAYAEAGLRTPRAAAARRARVFCGVIRAPPWAIRPQPGCPPRRAGQRRCGAFIKLDEMWQAFRPK